MTNRSMRWKATCNQRKKRQRRRWRDGKVIEEKLQKTQTFLHGCKQETRKQITMSPGPELWERGNVTKRKEKKDREC